MSPEPTEPAAAVDPTFASLGVAPPLAAALAELGYEAPTPIQAAAIPPLLAGRDLIGQAQTGTGKTAAFGLPLLQKIDTRRRGVQALVLAPTRELAIQVAEALHRYGKDLPGLVVAPVYGGQPIEPQSRRLQRGAHVVVGTPGRVMDHLRRGTLKLDDVRFVVLDEADEMLDMGFLEDVDTILGQAPPASSGRQTALFSATMAPAIRRIATEHLHDPARLEMAHREMTVPTIEQRFLVVTPPQKLEALTRLLESEPIDAVLVFTRTRTAAAEVAEKLEARGYDAAPLHGDMTQPMRERVIERLRSGQLDVVVATDVAARGLDLDRISHVVNYDIPTDVEAYVHRIGRTGRAGRAGVAILLVAPRERRLLRELERFTGRRIAAMPVPSPADVASRRKELLKQSLRETIEKENLDLYLALVEEMIEEGTEVAEIAAAGAWLARRDRPLENIPVIAIEAPRPFQPSFTERRDRRERGEVGDGRSREMEPMTRIFLDAGRESGVRPGDIVGAIANEAGISGREIGAIDIHERFSLVEIPARVAQQVLASLGQATLRGRPIGARPAKESEAPMRPRRPHPPGRPADGGPRRKRQGPPFRPGQGRPRRER